MVTATIIAFGTSPFYLFIYFLKIKTSDNVLEKILVRYLGLRDMQIADKPG